METDIFYFSGSGNSFMLAKMFSNKIAGSRIFNLVKYRPIRCDSSDKNFILVFPTHGFSLPNVVIRFLKNIKLECYSYYFIVTTKAGSPEFCYDDLSKIFKRKNRKIDAFFSIKMPNNSVFIHDFNTPEDQKNKLNDAKAFVESSISLIEKREKIVPPKQKMRITQFISFKVINKIAHKTSYMGFNKGFSASASCNSCGICSKICPSNKIKMENGHPSWNNNVECLICTACINYCPKGAIKNKILKQSKINPSNQYRNPDVSVNELIANNS